MSPEERELLNRVAKTVEENNLMLRSIRSSMRWATVWRWIYWVIIIGSAIGAFWLIQPYLTSLESSYSGAQSDISQFKSFLNSNKQQ